MAYLRLGSQRPDNTAPMSDCLSLTLRAAARQRGLRAAAVQLREDMSRLKDRTSSLASPVETPR